MSSVVRPENDDLCWDCLDPLFIQLDVFCPMCGRRLLHSRAVPDNLLLLLEDNAEDSTREITLDNSASRQAVSFKLESPDNAILLGPSRQKQFQSEVAGGETEKLVLRLNPGQIDRDRDDFTTEVLVSFPGTILPDQTVSIRVGPLPKFECEVKPFPLLKAGAVVRSSGRLCQTAGIPVRLLAASVDQRAFTPEGLPDGQTLELGRNYTFTLACDPAALPGPGRYAAKLRLQFDAGTIEVSVAVELERPPRLAIPAGRLATVPRGLLGDVSVTLRNSGGGALVLASLDFPNCPEWFRKPSLPSDQARRTLDANQTLHLHGEVDGERMELGEHQVEVVARSTGGLTAKQTIRVRVVPCQDYPHYVAFDFGTTNSCVAYWTDDNQVKMVPFVDLAGEARETVPSVAYFDEENERWLVGFEAAAHEGTPRGAERLVHSVKRLLNEGRVSDKRIVEVLERKFQPEDVAAAVFRYLRRQTERHLKARVASAMITLPANFTDIGVRGTLEAARRGGLATFQEDNREMWRDHRLDEPTAAAIDVAGGREQADEQDKLVLIFDFGGGTLDVSVLLIAVNPDSRRIQVLAHKGANWLGGDDLTMSLVRLIADKFRQQSGLPLRFDVRALRDEGSWDDLDEIEQVEIYRNQRMLWEAAETAKIALSRVEQVTVTPRLSVEGQEQALAVQVTKSEFEQAIGGHVRDALMIVDRAVKRAALSRPGLLLDSIHDVVATGGTSLVPLVRAKLAEHCGRSEDKLARYPGFDEKKCVSRGACRYAVENKEMPAAIGEALLECLGINQLTNCSYGVSMGASKGVARTIRFECFIPEGTRLPDGGAAEAEVVRKMPIQTSDIGSAAVVVYQHTGDPDRTIIEPGDRDFVHIDTIKVTSRLRNTPIEVAMWVGNDGLLEAEAKVQGQAKVFRLENRYQV